MLAISRHKSLTSLRQQPLGDVPYLSAICAVFHKQRPPSVVTRPAQVSQWTALAVGRGKRNQQLDP